MPESTIRTVLHEVRDIKQILIGDGSVESMEKSIQFRLTNVEAKLDEHIKRPKDDDGKLVERRNGWYKWKKRLPVIGLIISLLTFIGGWQACEYIEHQIHNMFIDYAKHLND